MYFIKLQDKIISTLDLFEDAYVLLVSEDVTFDALKFELPIPKGMPLRVYRYKKDFFSVDDAFDRIYQLKSHTAILVRPDGHVAFMYRK